MNRRIWSLVSVLTGLVSAGCSSHYVRDGIWELSFRVERSENREPLPIPKREVRVQVESTQDEAKPELKEIAEISPVEVEAAGKGAEASSIGRKPMYAEVESREEHETVVKILHKDEDWILQMGGVVKDAETILGTRLVARPHYVQNAAFEGGVGSWSMKWLRDR